MNLESHLSVMKRMHLFPHNRPRVDLIVHIIASNLMAKYDADYGSLKIGHKSPFWWNQFIKNWKTQENTTINGNYETDITQLYFHAQHGFAINSLFANICQLRVQFQILPGYNSSLSSLRFHLLKL